MSLKTPEPGTRDGRLYQTIADLDRRLRLVEGEAGFPQIDTTPTSEPRDGVGVVDKEKVRLWMRVNGAWRYVALT